MLAVIITIFTIIALNPSLLPVEQKAQCVNPAVRRTVQDARERPKNTIDYSRVAQLKLKSRKSGYKRGEIIDLHFALLNTGGEPVFFHRLSAPFMKVMAKDDKGNEVVITPTIIPMEGVTPQAFSLLGNNKIMTGSFNLLAGCDAEELKEFNETRSRLENEVHQGKIELDKGIFERDLFVNWGDACLRLTRPGTYLIEVEATNQHVIVSPCEPNIKTAIGKIRSAPLIVAVSP